MEERLPELKHLDISHNNGVHLAELFNSSCTWDKLLKLNVAFTETQLEISKRRCACLHLQELTISDGSILNLNRGWPNLQKLCIEQVYMLDEIAQGVEQGRFPALRDVCIQSSPGGFNLYEISTVIKFLEGNISVHKLVSPLDPFTSVTCLC